MKFLLGLLLMTLVSCKEQYYKYSNNEYEEKCIEYITIKETRCISKFSLFNEAYAQDIGMGMDYMNPANPISPLNPSTGTTTSCTNKIVDKIICKQYILTYKEEQ